MPWKDKKEAKRKLKIWRGKNRFRISLYSRKFKYGLNANEFNLLVESRNNKCEICGVFLKESKEIHIDHDHTTKMVRGLLCGNCNTASGMLGDDPSLLMALAELNTEDDIRSLFVGQPTTGTRSNAPPA